ncbi:glycosyltransferase family 4 protein [Mycobacterium sp. GA-1285]|uniref:glycosyltransferase family 4 protein n=1 Tax=Mycobacterium sp. GA-1285 TaxID=1772282 RepID=UPI000ABE27C1|nr:glycosyltransferase family 4 protein [Mycobacterium sp. GA-1285]
MAEGSLPKTMECVRSRHPLRIALVYSRFPFPMMRGDQMTVAHLLGFLAARGHAVDLYTLAVDGELDAKQTHWLQEVCRTVQIYPQPWHAKVTGLACGLFVLLPLQVSIFRNSKLKRDLSRAINSDDYDVVYCYYPRTAPAVPRRLSTRTAAVSFLALQLSQTLNTKRMAQYERSRMKRLVYRIETVLMGRYEARVWKDFDKVVLIGPADVAAVKEQCRKHGEPEIDNWIYGAHGTDTKKFVAADPNEVVPGRIIFSGSMLYPPNIYAVLWFVDNVWPAVRAQIPEAKFIVQGRDPAAKIVELDGRDGISVTGTVPDVGVLIRSAQVCVNPMLAAGGMQNKLIEYMACGKAVVATSVANEGIRAPDTALVIADDAHAFASAVIHLLSEPDEAARLGSAARRYVLSEWTWEKHFLDLEAAFHHALEGSTARSAFPPRDTSRPIGQ